MPRSVKYHVEWGEQPDYITKRGKYLWIDKAHYDAYSSVTHSKILVDKYGKFWGYSDDPDVLRKDAYIRWKRS